MHSLPRTEMCSPHKVNRRGLGKDMPAHPARAPRYRLHKVPGAHKSPTRTVVARDGCVCSAPRRNVAAALLAHESLRPVGLARIRGRDRHPDDLGTCAAMAGRLESPGVGCTLPMPWQRRWNRCGGTSHGSMTVRRHGQWGHTSRVTCPDCETARAANILQPRDRRFSKSVVV